MAVPRLVEGRRSRNLCLEPQLQGPDGLETSVSSSEEMPTRRIGWILTWDIFWNTIKVQEEEDGQCWEEKVGQFPKILQEIIPKGIKGYSITATMTSYQ